MWIFWSLSTNTEQPLTLLCWKPHGSVPTDEVLVSVIPLHQGSASGAVRGLLSDFRVPCYTGSNLIAELWYLDLNSVSHDITHWCFYLELLIWSWSWSVRLWKHPVVCARHSSVLFRPWAGTVLAGVVHLLGCSGHTPVLESETLPGHGGRQGTVTLSSSIIWFHTFFSRQLY